MRVIAEKILHAFESNGNIHLIFGVSTGQIDPNGDDFYEPVITLVVPGSCVHTVISGLQDAVKILVQSGDKNSAFTENSALRSEPIRQTQEEILGVGIKVHA